jgi:hypothetical protein
MKDNINIFGYGSAEMGIPDVTAYYLELGRVFYLL